MDRFGQVWTGLDGFGTGSRWGRDVRDRFEMGWGQVRDAFVDAETTRAATAAVGMAASVVAAASAAATVVTTIKIVVKTKAVAEAAATPAAAAYVSGRMINFVSIELSLN